VVLAVHGRKAGERRWVVWAAGLVLVQLGQIEEALEAEAHTGEVEGRRAARIEVLMHRAIGDVERAALVPDEPLAIYDAEAFPLEEVDRLLAVGVLPGVPPDGNLGLEDIASHRCKAIRVA